MPIAIHQKTSTHYAFYQSQDTEVVDPFGNSIIVPVDQSSKSYSQQISAVTDKYDRASALAGIASGKISGPMRNRGMGNQWDTYDIGFMPDEVDEQTMPGIRQAAYDAVKEWAGNYNVKGNQGTRMFTIQEWHEDGNQPHLRVDVSRVIYTSQNTVGPMGPIDAGQTNKDLENLDKALTAAGFAPMQRAGIGTNGATQTTQGQVQPKVPASQQVSQHLQGTQAPQDAEEQDGEAATFEEGQEEGVEGSTPSAAPASTATPATTPATSKVPYTLKNFSNGDLLAQRAKELDARMAADLTEYTRIKAAIDALAENTVLKEQKTALTAENRDLTRSLDDLANDTKTELASRDPALAAQVATLPPAEVIKVGLDSLTSELDTAVTDLTNALHKVQEQADRERALEEKISEQVEGALAEYLDHAERQALAAQSLPEKVQALSEKLETTATELDTTATKLGETTTELQETASQKRYWEAEWGKASEELKTTGEALKSTQQELTTTTADRDAKAVELTTKTEELAAAQADITAAVEAMRAASPELFKNNPELEKSVRASIEATITQAKEVEQKRQELETQLKTATDANKELTTQNAGLQTQLQTMQQERDTARKALQEAQQKLEAVTKDVERLTKVESNVERLLKPRVEGWESMSREDALDSLAKKYDEIQQQKNTAIGQVEFYKENITSLQDRVKSLEERLDTQQQNHSQQIAALIQNQNQPNQGNMPTQTPGATRSTPTQGGEGNKPDPKKGKDFGIDDE